MSGRITLVSHSSTTATNAAAFAADEPLDERGARWALDARGQLPTAARTHCSPARSCRETATALDLTAATDPLLQDWDLGRWRGRRIDEVSAAEPDAVRTWLTAAGAAPHGGEPLTDLLARCAGWLAAVPGDGHTVAVTHPAVVRAVVLAVLGAPAEGFWRIDVAPLTATVLRGGPGRWTLRSTGAPVARRPDPPHTPS